MAEELRFGECVWPCNPSSLTVHYGRRLAELTPPRAGGVLQDLGPERRQATGEGILPGADAAEKARALAALCMQGGSSLLVLPGHDPFYAVLRSLEIEGSPEPEGIRCRFAFWEDQRGNAGGEGEGA